MSDWLARRAKRGEDVLQESSLQSLHLFVPPGRRVAPTAAQTNDARPPLSLRLSSLFRERLALSFYDVSLADLTGVAQTGRDGLDVCTTVRP